MVLRAKTARSRSDGLHGSGPAAGPMKNFCASAFPLQWTVKDEGWRMMLRRRDDDGGALLMFPGCCLVLALAVMIFSISSNPLHVPAITSDLTRLQALPPLVHVGINCGPPIYAPSSLRKPRAGFDRNGAHAAYHYASDAIPSQPCSTPLDV